MSTEAETAAPKAAVENETPKPSRLRRGATWARAAVLVPLLALANVSFVFVRARQGQGQPYVDRQRQAQALTPQAVARVVRVAPDPVTRKAGLTSRCVALGNGALRNPWTCAIRYREGRVISYQVTINADGSYSGDNELVRFRGQRFTDTGTINGCCITIP